MEQLVIKNLNKSYNQKQILKDLSFSVEKNEIVSVLGSSGSGKTTLLKCILGLEKSDSGEISIDSRTQGEWLKNNRISYVPQKYANFNHLTVEQNVASAKGEMQMGGTGMDRLLKGVGLERHRCSYPHALSGGMQQRLALARSLAQNSSIMAFDESLSALDVETRHQMQELILELWKENKKTIIFVTHDIEEALYLSNRVIVMGTKPGTIREIINVPFTYPRKSSLRFEEEFQRIRRALSYVIRSESIKGKLSEDEKTQSNAIKLGLYYWPGNSPFFYAQDKELFDKYQLPIELVSFSDNRQKIEYWKSNKIDILNVTVDTALRLVREVSGTEIIAGLNISIGGDALIARKKIKNIKDLTGKRIALEKSEVSEFFLKYILYKNNVNINEVVICDMKGDEIGSALIKGEVDAAVLWEPWLSKACELSRSRILATSSDYPILADVLIAKKEFINYNKNRLELLKKIWREATRSYQIDKKEFIRSVAPMVGISSQELGQQLEKIKFYNGSTTEVAKIARQIKNII